MFYVAFIVVLILAIAFFLGQLMLKNKNLKEENEKLLEELNKTKK